MIKEFLEKNLKTFNYKNFIVTKIQVNLILMLLAGFAYYFAELNIIIFVQLILSIVFFHSLIEVKKQFQEFNYFLLLFGSMYLVIQLMWINNLILPTENKMDLGFILIFILVVIAIVFSVLIKKNNTTGKVLSSNGTVTVIETEFDIKSLTKGEKHIIETTQKFKEGTKLKIRIKKSLFGKTVEII